MIQATNKITAQTAAPAHSKRNFYRPLWLLIAASIAFTMPAAGQAKNTGVGSSAASTAPASA